MTLVEDLRIAMGQRAVVDDPDVMQRWLVDPLGRHGERPLAVIRPTSTTEVATAVRVCRDAGVAIVPQGGNTGLVGGCWTPRGSVLLSLTGLTSCGDVQPAGSITVGAGCTLAEVQRAAQSAGWRFPVDFGARDSATVGGMVATNAGGVHAFRHGSMRRQVLGLEWVTPDGEVVQRLEPLRKRSSGLAMVELLCGSEGTLGVITAATLRLVPDVQTAVLWFDRPNWTDLFALAWQCAQHDAVTALEFMGPECLDGADHGSLLVEVSDSDNAESAVAHVMGQLGDSGDPTVGVTAAQKERLWERRHRIPAVINTDGTPWKGDVAVSPRLVPEVLDLVDSAVHEICPTAMVWKFGHAGDGNIHLNVTGASPDQIISVEAVVYEVILEHGGTIAAEHGIGRVKSHWLPRMRTPTEATWEHALRRTVDPYGLMNPGVFGVATTHDQ